MGLIILYKEAGVMFKYMLLLVFFVKSEFVYAQNIDTLSGQLVALYEKQVKESDIKQMPIFAVQDLGLAAEKSFNLKIFQDIQNVVKNFGNLAIEGVSTPSLYTQMEAYIAEESLLSQGTKSPFKGCKARLHKVENKSCISSQELYVLPYSSEDNKNKLINRYFNTYTLSTDNSSFFTMDVYEKQPVDKGQCVYKQKQWTESSYALPEESVRSSYIDKEVLKLGEPKTMWFCSNSYSLFGSDKQVCNLLQVEQNKVESQGMEVNILSAFSAQENSCNVKIEQKQVVKYSKKHKKIISANSESSYYSVVVKKNNHLLIYTNSVYCSEKPKVKELYEDNLSNIQSYVCIGEDDSSYFSNYRLLGIDPEQRSEGASGNIDGEFTF